MQKVVNREVFFTSSSREKRVYYIRVRQSAAEKEISRRNRILHKIKKNNKYYLGMTTTTKNTFLCTTRFTDATWQENCDFRTSRKTANVGCVYASPFLLNTRIPKRARVFIIEMNNSQNRIVGIGLVRNYAIAQKYRVYTNEEYNRYVFLGKYRLDRSQISDAKLLERLEQFCFRGIGHHKRLRGITQITRRRWCEWAQENWKIQLDTPPLQEPPPAAEAAEAAEAEAEAEPEAIIVRHIVCDIDQMFCEKFHVWKSEIHW